MIQESLHHDQTDRDTAMPPPPPPTKPQPLLSRPSFLDYLFLLGGVGLSLYLMQLAPIRAEADPAVSDPRLASVIAFLPELMRIPEGVVLLWPLFFATQWPGRSRGLTLGEWLWLFAWVGFALLTALTALHHLGGMPDFMLPHAAKPRLLWYMIAMPAMGGLALVFLVVSMFKPAPPWTHNLGLALVLWPAVPALAILAFGRFSALPT
jgi:hypothetical protein